MGHRRVGVLPKTQRWRDLVDQLETFSGDEAQLERIVTTTLAGVRDRFLRVESAPSVFESFKYLVAFAVASGTDEPAAFMAESGFVAPMSDTPLGLARALARFIEGTADSPEYASIARASACDALSRWYRATAPETPSLFADDAGHFVGWRQLSSGAGFCELSRFYFSGLTDRYLRYFLDREASRSISTLFERDSFDRQLASRVEDVARHAFETAKITQSFAAGWFNKNARTGVPTDQQIRGFLSLAFGKMRAELGREASGQ
jgi:hypothetical protein